MKRLNFISFFLFIIFYGVKSKSIFETRFEILHKEPPPPKSVGRTNVQTLTIEQKLDNFDEKNEKTWKMRYMANLEHFKSSSPIFIFVGGEWEITPGFITAGHFYDIGRQLNAAFFYTEHRYYGQSYPTKNFTTENLRYLSVRQALADLENFIKTIKTENLEMRNSTVILAGGSYSGTMVTWFKREYPELVAGAWASSAPVFAKADFLEYKEVAGRSIRKIGGQTCYNRIENGIKELENLLKQNKIAEVKTLLKLCDNFDENNQYDEWNLFSSISDIFAGLVQGHNRGDIENACTKIMSEKDDLSGLISWLLSKLDANSKCHDFSYDDTVKTLSNTNLTKNLYRQWIYQTCSEFGWYQTSKSKSQPFGTKFPLKLYSQLCEDVYGINETTLFENIENSNKYWGGWVPNVQNVFFSHGDLDPWSAMGLQKNDDDENNVIPLYAHCKDFPSISLNDSQEMKDSKIKFKNLVKKWLSEQFN